MKKILFAILFFISALTFNSCIEAAYAETVVPDDDVTLIVRYGTPYYYNGAISYYYYGGYYYYPRVYGNSWRYYRYSRPIPHGHRPYDMGRGYHHNPVPHSRGGYSTPRGGFNHNRPNVGRPNRPMGGGHNGGFRSSSRGGRR